MKVYKIWHDTKHFIHKDTVDELSVKWTENIAEAKDVDTSFYFEVLKFNRNIKYDALRLV